MTLYVDSSALLKRYVDEHDSAVAAELMKSDPVLVTSRLTEVEVRRNLARLLDGEELDMQRQAFAVDLDAFALVSLDATTMSAAAMIAEQNTLSFTRFDPPWSGTTDRLRHDIAHLRRAPGAGCTSDRHRRHRGLITTPMPHNRIRQSWLPTHEKSPNEMKLDPDDALARLAAHDHGILCTLHAERGVDAVPVTYAIDEYGYVGVPVDTVKPKASAHLQRQRNLGERPAGHTAWRAVGPRRLVTAVVGTSRVALAG